MAWKNAFQLPRGETRWLGGAYGTRSPFQLIILFSALKKKKKKNATICASFLFFKRSHFFVCVQIWFKSLKLSRECWKLSFDTLKKKEKKKKRRWTDLKKIQHLTPVDEVMRGGGGRKGRFVLHMAKDFPVERFLLPVWVSAARKEVEWNEKKKKKRKERGRSLSGGRVK